MNAPDFNTTILVDKTPKQAFDAITNVRGWWSEEIEGDTDKLDSLFIYHFEDIHYSQIKIIELIPEKKVVWFIKYNYFKFTKDKSEWTGTKINFDISEKDNKTEIRVTHVGLNPEEECYDVCSKAWTHYIQQSLYGLITNGVGQPNGKDKPSTEDERRFKAEAN